MRIALIGIVVLVSGCGATECCQDHSSYGVVAGVVVDGRQTAQEGVDLAAVEFREECDPTNPGGGWGTARTDGDGTFTMEVDMPLMSPGLYCFDMVMTRGTMADTVEQIQLRAASDTRSVDTTRMTLVVPW